MSADSLARLERADAERHDSMRAQWRAERHDSMQRRADSMMAQWRAEANRRRIVAALFWGLELLFLFWLLGRCGL